MTWPGGYPQFHISMAVMALVATIGCGRNESQVDKCQFQILVPTSMTVRDICFSADGSWLVISATRHTSAGIERKCIEYSIAQMTQNVLPFGIDSVERWGTNMVICDGENVSMLSSGLIDKSNLQPIAPLPLDEGAISSFGLVETNEIDIATVPRWISYEFERKKDLKPFVVGDSPDCAKLTTLFDRIQDSNMHIRAAAISRSVPIVAAISYSEEGKVGVAASVTSDKSLVTDQWKKFEFDADEPPAISIDPDGKYLACLSRSGTKFCLFALQNQSLAYTIDFEKKGDDFEVATQFAGQILEISLDGKFIGAVTIEGGVILELLTGKVVEHYAFPVTSVTLHPRERQIAFGLTKPGRVEVYTF